MKSFEELTTNELFAILKERVNIFVVEQNCPYPEIDDHDKIAHHLFKEEHGEIIAYARILPQEATYREVAIGRVIVTKKQRGYGVGHELMERAMDFILNDMEESIVKLSSQDYIKHFYESFGFKPVSNVYLDDGIPHVDMLYKKSRQE